jgi:hypothetical protein
MDSISMPVLAGFVSLHLAGLAAAWATRLARGSRAEPMSQLAFFAIMGAIGLTACLCCRIELEFSVPSGVTLMAMVLTAVADFRPTHEPAGRILG